MSSINSRTVIISRAVF